MRGGPVGVVLVLLLTAFAGCLAATLPLVEPGPVKGLPVTPGDYKFSLNRSQVLQPGPFEILPVHVQILRSTLDNADIPVGIFRPDVPEDVKTPIIIHASPYFTPDLTNQVTLNKMARMRDEFVPHGYTVVALPVRGTGNAGGCMDLMGAKERHDLNQAITWLAQQPWSNGNVGLIGVSYDGSTPFMAAAMNNPAVKTIVPISGLPDIYDLMYRNGTSETRGLVQLNLLYYQYFMTAGRDADKQIMGAICPESWVGLAASAWSGTTGAHDPTGWWEERNSRPAIEATYKGSILFVQGLQDWNVDPALAMPWVQRLADENGLVVHQWLGQWAHAWPDSACRTTDPTRPTCRWDWAQYTLQWFDRWLKEDQSVDVGPAVQVQRHDNVWRTEAAWPPHDAAPVTLELSSGGKLAPKGEGRAAGSIRLLPNPTGQLYAPTGQPLPPPVGGYYADFRLTAEQDLWIAGLPKVHVTVVPEGPGGTLAAWLYLRDADGQMERIGWTAMNLLFADGGREATPVVPGEPLVARMQIQPMDALVPAGSELVLRIWQYPPNDRRVSPIATPIELQWGSGRSLLELPLVVRDGSTGFAPPFPDPVDG